MQSDRKKELKESYKSSKTSMGVYQIKNILTGKTYVGVTQNLKGTMNGNIFKLDSGMFKDRELQSEWKINGSSNYEETVLAELDYDSDESKTDYTEDLKVLREMVTEDITDKKFI